MALTKTPNDLASAFWLDMMSRGLGYRNDGPELADAKRDAFKRMLAKYPPDAVKVCCEKLRPSGFFPSVDEVELEIQEVLKWRMEIHAVLLEGEVFTEEQLWEMRNRALSHTLTEKNNRFPIWDGGKPKHREDFEKAISELQAALDDYIAFNPEPEDFMDKRSVRIARENLAADFVPYPTRDTAEERTERLRQAELEHEQRKAEALAAFEASVEDDMIAEIEGQRHV